MPSNGEAREEQSEYEEVAVAAELEAVANAADRGSAHSHSLSHASSPSSAGDSWDGSAVSETPSPMLTEEEAAEASSSINGPPAHAVVVFDWDDTLLSSSALASRGHGLDTQLEFDDELAQALQSLERAVVEVLTTAEKHGTVVIITNAETGWVQLSCEKFIPSVRPFLDRIPVVSARSTYEGQYPDCPLKWKYCAFLDQITQQFNRLAPRHALSPRPRHIVSFGDSQVEREAVRAMSPCFPDALIKSIKFAERPSLEQLCRQVELVNSCFNSILSHEGELDLMLTVHIPN